MPSSAIANAISSSVTGYRLLDHPYYRAWERGELRPEDLRGYAEQYRHFERCLPDVLSKTAAQLGPGEPRRLVEANLEDEMTNPCPHLELYDRFSNSLGADESTSPSTAASELVGLYMDAAERGPVPALAVIAAYEVQAAEVAATKAEALALHYRLPTEATEFWTVHATVEQHHAAWTVQALETLNATAADVRHWAARSARTWSQFLDEREALRAA